MKAHSHTRIAYTILALGVAALAACQAGAPQATPGPTAAHTPAASSPASTPAEATQPAAGWDGGCFGQPLASCAWFRQGLIGAEQGVLDSLEGASVYRIDLHIPGDLATLTGQQRILYTNREDVALDTLYFQLFPNIAGGQSSVSGVKVNEQAVDVVYEYSNSVVRVPLPTALQPGQQAAVEMNFEVDVPREMGGNYGLFGYFEGVLVLDEFYPAIPVYDDEGWNVKLQPNGDVTYFDASFYLVRVTAPAWLTLVASGIEVDRERAGEEQVVVYAIGPSRDFYLAASQDLTVVSEAVGETTVNSYASAQRAQGARQALSVAVDALKSYNARFGTYPYTEFDVVSTPMQALGIEYPGMTGIALNLYDPDASVSGLPAFTLLESTVAHEVAHQWFYNVVGNDQVDEPWMDEAIVQYVTSLYYVDTYGEQAAQSYRDSWEARWERVERAAIPIGLPAGDYEGREYGAIVYGRGPLFVQALANAMGQGRFDKFLRDYYESHKWGIGTGEAFRQLAEQHCQCNLADLFEAWVYSR